MFAVLLNTVFFLYFLHFLPFLFSWSLLVELLIIIVLNTYFYTLSFFAILFHVDLEKELTQILLLEEMLLKNVHNWELLRLSSFILCLILNDSWLRNEVRSVSFKLEKLHLETSKLATLLSVAWSKHIKWPFPQYRRKQVTFW